MPDPQRHGSSMLHNGPTAILCSAVSPDQSVTVAGGYGGVLLLLEPSSGTLTQRSLPSRKAILDLSVSYGSRLLALAVHDGSVIVWDMLGERPFTRLRPRAGFVRRVAWCGGGAAALLALATSEGTIEVWDPRKRAVLRVISAHQCPITALKASPSGDQLLAGDCNGTVTLHALWGRSDASVEQRVSHDAIVAVAFVSDKQVAVATATGRLFVLPPDLGLARARQCVPTHGTVTTLGSSPEGLIAIGYISGEVHVLSAETLQVCGSVLRSSVAVCGAHFVRGSTLLRWCADGSATLFDWPYDRPGTEFVIRVDPLVDVAQPRPDLTLIATASGGLLAVSGIEQPQVSLVTTLEESVVAAAINPHHQSLAAVTLEGDVVAQEGPPSRRSATRWSDSLAATAVAVAAKSGTIVTGHADGQVAIRTTGHGGEVKHKQLGDAPVSSVATDAEGLRVAYTTWNGDFGVWDVSRGDVWWQRRSGHKTHSAVLSADGDKLAALGPGTTISVWDTSSRKEIARLPTASWDFVDICGQSLSRYFVLTKCGALLVCEATQRTACMLTEPEAGGPRCLSTTDDGSSLVVGFTNGRIEVWDAQTLRRRWKAQVVSEAVIAVGGGPTGITLVTQSGRVYRYSRLTREIKQVGYLGDPPTAAAVSRDGGCVVAGASDGTVASWSLNGGVVQRPPREVCARDITFDPYGRCAAAIFQDGYAIIWQMPSLRVFREFRAARPSDGVRGVALSTDGSTICIACSRQLSFWHVKQARKLSSYVYRSATGTVRGVSFLSTDTVVVACDNGVLWIQDVSNKQRHMFSFALGTPTAATFAPGGTLVVGDAQGHLALWDIGTNRCVAALASESGAVCAVAAAPDRDTVTAVTDAGRLIRFSLSTRPPDVRIWRLLRCGPHWIAEARNPGGS